MNDNNKTKDRNASSKTWVIVTLSVALIGAIALCTSSFITNYRQFEDGRTMGYEQGYKDGLEERKNESISGEDMSTEMKKEIEDSFSKEDVSSETSEEKNSSENISKGFAYLGEDEKAYQRGGNNFDEYSPGAGESILVSGVKYYRGIVASDHGGGPGWGLYNLKGAYSKLSGIIGHVDESEMNNGVVRFWGDGELILEYELIADALGTELSIDITGIKQLKIEFDFYRTSYALVDAILSK